MPSPRPLVQLAAAAVACSSFALPSQASEEVFFSQSSIVYKLGASSPSDSFLPACFSQVKDMAHIDSMLYVVDAWGGLMGVDILSPTGLQFETLAFDAVSIVVHDGDLLVAGDNGTIQRHDSTTLAVLGSFSAGSPIADMVLDGSDLWVAAPDGTVLRGDADTGDFDLAGICAGALNSLFAADGNVFLGSSTGTVFILEQATGLMAYAYTAPNDAISMARDGETLLIGGSDGSIHRYELGQDNLLESFQHPFAIESLLHYDNPQHLELSSTVQESSLKTGVEATLSLEAGAEHAGELFFVLGSMSSTWPGIPVDGLLVPIAPDPYFWMTVQGGLGILNGGFGVLPPSGQATATFSLPGGAASASFLQFHHTAVTLDPFTLTLTGVAPATTFWALN